MTICACVFSLRRAPAVRCGCSQGKAPRLTLHMHVSVDYMIRPPDQKLRTRVKTHDEVGAISDTLHRGSTDHDGAAEVRGGASPGRFQENGSLRSSPRKRGCCHRYIRRSTWRGEPRFVRSSMCALVPSPWAASPVASRTPPHGAQDTPVRSAPARY